MGGERLTKEVSVAGPLATSTPAVTERSASVDAAAWYRQYGEAVFRRALRYTREPARAKDIVQEVFMKVHRAKESWRGESSPLAWLFTITDRCFFDTLRKARLETADVEVLLSLEGGALEPRMVARDALVRLLSRAEDDVRRILILRYCDELELGDIAKELGVNERTVRRKLERFVERARRILR